VRENAAPVPSNTSKRSRGSWTRRRTVVGAVGTIGVALAGCLGTDTIPDPGGGSTARERTTETTGEGRSTEASGRQTCPPDVDLPDADGGPSYPSLPDADSGAVVMDFALRFEEAYQRNRIRILESPLTYVEVTSTDATEPKRVEGGTLVAVRLDVAFGYESHTSVATDTPETVHGGHSASAAYLVAGRRALRVETDGLQRVDPRESADGAVVACAD
jgi:hypothetical protein